MLIPRPDKIFVAPIYDPETIGSIYIPEMAKERCDQGIVKYVGAGCKWLRPGDYVLFSGYAGDTVDLEGEGIMLVMMERQVLAIIGDASWTSSIVPGLYHKSKEGYFQATIESSFPLIQDTLQNNSKIRQSLRYKKMDRRFWDPEDVMEMEEEFLDGPKYE